MKNTFLAHLAFWVVWLVFDGIAVGPLSGFRVRGGTLASCIGLVPGFASVARTLASASRSQRSV